jgi:hypothetical protein
MDMIEIRIILTTKNKKVVSAGIARVQPVRTKKLKDCRTKIGAKVVILCKQGVFTRNNPNFLYDQILGGATQFYFGCTTQILVVRRNCFFPCRQALRRTQNDTSDIVRTKVTRPNRCGKVVR